MADHIDETSIAEAVFLTLDSYLEDGLSEARVDYQRRSFASERDSNKATLTIDGRAFRLLVREVRA